MNIEEIKQAYKEQKEGSIYYGKHGHIFDYYLGKKNILLESIIFRKPPISIIKRYLLKHNNEYIFGTNKIDKDKLIDFEPNWKDNLTYIHEFIEDNIISYFYFFKWQIRSLYLSYPQIYSDTNTDDIKGGICIFYILIPNNKFNIEKISKVMDLFGYYNSQIIDAIDSDMIDKNLSQHFDDWVVLTFEPQFQETINKIIANNKYLYHISPSYCDNKILKQGLVPKSKNKWFKYPDRIYVFVDITLDKVNDEYKKFLEESSILNIPYYEFVADRFNIARTSDGLTNEMSYRNEFEYSLWQIDNTNLNNNFCIDYNFQPFALYTTENISPNKLTKIKTITL